VAKALKMQQMGVQYLLYLQELAKKQRDTKLVYSKYERDNAEKLKEFKSKQEEKLADLQRKNEHLDYLIWMHDEKLKKSKRNAASPLKMYEVPDAKESKRYNE